MLKRNLHAGLTLSLVLWAQTGWCDGTESASSQFKSFLNDMGNSAGKAVGQNVSNVINGAAGNSPTSTALPQPDNAPPALTQPVPNTSPKAGGTSSKPTKKPGS
jgi:hypothetical protein